MTMARLPMNALMGESAISTWRSSARGCGGCPWTHTTIYPTLGTDSSKVTGWGQWKVNTCHIFSRLMVPQSVVLTAADRPMSNGTRTCSSARLLFATLIQLDLANSVSGSAYRFLPMTLPLRLSCHLLALHGKYVVRPS